MSDQSGRGPIGTPIPQAELDRLRREQNARNEWPQALLAEMRAQNKHLAEIKGLLRAVLDRLAPPGATPPGDPPEGRP